MGEIFCAGTLLWVQAFFKSVSTDGFESFERKSSRIAGWTCWPLRSAFLNDNDDDSDSDDGDDGDDDDDDENDDVDNEEYDNSNDDKNDDDDDD